MSDSEERSDGYPTFDWDKAIDKTPAPQDDYSAGRTGAQFISMVGWLVVIVGFVSLYSTASLVPGGGFKVMIAQFAVAAIPSVAVIIGGFVQVMIAQLAIATFDNANHTKRMVAILEFKLQSEDATK